MTPGNLLYFQARVVLKFVFWGIIFYLEFLDMFSIKYEPTSAQPAFLPELSLLSL